MPTKAPSFTSDNAVGTTSTAAQLSASLTSTEVPSRVAMVAVLPSMAAMLPRRRVGGDWDSAAPAMASATNAATPPASKRMRVMNILPFRSEKLGTAALAGPFTFA